MITLSSEMKWLETRMNNNKFEGEIPNKMALKIVEFAKSIGITKPYNEFGYVNFAFEIGDQYHDVSLKFKKYGGKVLATYEVFND